MRVEILQSRDSGYMLVSPALDCDQFMQPYLTNATRGTENNSFDHLDYCCDV